jgi:hypothetical protein
LESGKELEILVDSPGASSPIAALADIPEEEIWLANQKSPRTRGAYKLEAESLRPAEHSREIESST